MTKKLTTDAVSNIFHVSFVENYEDKRVEKSAWALEQAGLIELLPQPKEKLSKNFYREQMDLFFSGLGWKTDHDYQVDLDITGNRWIFLVSRL